MQVKRNRGITMLGKEGKETKRERKWGVTNSTHIYRVISIYATTDNQCSQNVL